MSLYDQLFDELAQVDMFDRYSIAISDSFAPELVAKVISSFRVYNDVELAVTSYSDLNCVDKETTIWCLPSVIPHQWKGVYFP